MSRRSWRYIIAAGGLATFVTTAGSLYATWWYASPQEPRIPRQEAPQRPERGYEPGGTGCDPKRLNTLAPEKAPAERDRCAQAREDHRIQEAELAQAARANDLAEGNLRLAYEQARIAFTQTIATVLAFIAAGVAAVFAGMAVYHSKRSADADNDALLETRAAAEEARKDAAEQAKRVTEQLRLTDQTMEFTAKGAYAMSDTARETRKLATAMQTSAEAAKQSVAVAALTAEAMERAALAAHVAERAYIFLGVDKVEREETGTLKCSVMVSNAGKSPGVVKAIYYKVYFEEPSGEITLFEPDGKYSDTDLVVSAGDERDGWQFGIGHMPRQPYFYGLICYEDVFRKIHFSRCCVKIDRENLTTEIAGSAPWNEWD